MNPLSTNKFLMRLPVWLLKQSALLSALACRLVQLTLKHPDPIHPKHIVQARPVWYLSFMKPYYRVLDVGCNNGQHTLRIAPLVNRVVGIDYDSRMLSLAKRERRRKELDNIALQQTDVEKPLPFKSLEFDAVIFLDVLEHLYNRELILGEISRILKKGGCLFLSVPNSDTRWKRLQKYAGLSSFSDPDHKVEYTKKEIEKVVKETGFTIKSISPVTLDTPLVGFIDLIGGISLSLYRQLSIWRRNQALKYPQESIGFELVCQKGV